MIRRLFTLASLLSLLLCVATVLLWVRSLIVGWNFYSNGVHFWTTRSGVQIVKIKGPIMGWEQLVDPQVYFGGYVNRANYIRIFIPYWAVTTVFAILPLSRLTAKFRRRRKQADGRCPACGYNLL